VVLDHRVERIASVRVCRVEVDQTLQVARFDEPGKAAVRGGLDLSHSLAQLGGNPGKMEGGVDLFFGSRRALARLGAKETAPFECDWDAGDRGPAR
jgi:hypothetical protein